jgi:deoxyribonuclease-4
MISSVRGKPGFAGICFDTCHAFASGYDFRTPERARSVLAEFDDTLGLELLKLSHVQDSKTDLGGHKDRHEHVGKGFIGRDGLAALLATPEFRRIDWILETESDGRANDLKALRDIRAKPTN